MVPDNTLPLFPTFTQLGIQHKDAVAAVADRFPSADFNFTGLFTWDVTEAVMVSSLDGNLVMRSSDYLTHEPFYSFIGDEKAEETAHTLLDYAEHEGYEPILKLIPESMAQKFEGSSSLTLIEDRDNDDYILSVQELVDFKANTYRGKKNLLNRYENQYGNDTKEAELDLGDEKTVSAISAVLHNWKESRNKTDEDIKDEIIAIKRSTDHHEALGMRGFGVYYKDELIAFTFFEILPSTIAVIHFDKADVRYEGIFERLKHTFAKHLSTLGVEFINYEQDLGVEGLRRAKLSYHPVRFIKKYSLTRQ